MRVFVAGASGAIGRPLIIELIRRGHEVTGMTRSESGARDLAALGTAVARASAFFLEAGAGLADESAGLALDASPRIAANARTYAELERRVLNSGEMEGVALRYGFFYGPGTWYHPDGASADQVRRQEVPIIGDGGGVWSWVHLEDAVVAHA